MIAWLPDWAILVLVAAVVVVLARLAVAVNRVRGVCEYWTRSPIRWRDGILLYGPALVVLLVGCFGARFAWWLPIPTAILGFGLFAAGHAVYWLPVGSQQAAWVFVIGTLVVGVLGALLGGLVASAAGLGGLGSFFSLGTWLVAIGGAFLLLVVYSAVLSPSAGRRRSGAV